jgi:hypothetical protein
MRFLRFMAIGVVLLASLVLGSACAGEKGGQGADGVGVEDVVFNADGTMTVNLTKGEKYTSDNLTGPQGIQGEPGPDHVIAAGWVDGGGWMMRSRGASHFEWDDDEEQYTITIPALNTITDVVLVTPYGSGGLPSYFANIAVASPLLYVSFFDNTGARVKCNCFTFVVMRLLA